MHDHLLTLTKALPPFVFCISPQKVLHLARSGAPCSCWAAAATLGVWDVVCNLPDARQGVIGSSRHIVRQWKGREEQSGGNTTSGRYPEEPDFKRLRTIYTLCAWAHFTSKPDFPGFQGLAFTTISVL